MLSRRTSTLTLVDLIFCATGLVDIGARRKVCWYRLAEFVMDSGPGNPEAEDRSIRRGHLMGEEPDGPAAG